jgi:hypothetical protein
MAVTKKKSPKAAKTKAKAKAPVKPTPRADFGTAIDSFFTKQPEPQRTIAIELRKLIEAAAPDATSAIKWGMPQWQLDGKMFVAIGVHKAHVNLILWGPPNAYKDPNGRLTGESKMGRHLKLTTVAELPRKDVQSWLATCAHLVRTK